MKEKTLKIIIFIVMFLLIIFLILSLTGILSPKLVFELNGSNHVTHNLNDEYKDLGVTLKKGNTDLSSEVVVNNNVDVNNVGNYVVTYSYHDQVLTRYVDVKKISSFELNGDNEIYLLINGTYPDPKVEAIDNEISYLHEVVINSNLDSSKIGDYKITYTSNKTNKVLERNIHVSNFDEYFKINYDDKTVQKEIILNITIDNEKISKYILPDGSIKTSNSNFTINKNGEYQFIIYDKYNNKLEKKINITNVKIIEPINASCKAIIKDGKTIIEVTSNKEIVKYIYNGVEKQEKTYTVNSEVKNNKVVLYDSDNQTKEITCTTKVEEKLEIHFIASGFYDDAILIRSNKATIFMDGGRGKDRVVNYLKELKINKIDYLIGSHTEYDHINAHALVMRTFKVDKAIYPNNIRKCGCSCDNNDVLEVIAAANATNTPTSVQPVPSLLTIGDMKLYFIAPTSIGCNKNNNSFVFILVYGNNKFMFTGDADSVLHNTTNLTNLAQKAGLSSGIDVDVLKYPHHGNQILDTKFINALSPEAIIVPNYNAPGYGSVAYRNQGIGVYRQSDSKTGNILVTSDGNKITYKMDVVASTYAK